MLKTARLLIRKSGIKALAYNPSEWTVDAFARLREKLTIAFHKSLTFRKKRIIKSDTELEILKKATHFGKDAFHRFGEFLKHDGLGLDEKMAHFEAEAIYRFKYHGQLGLSFSPIVAFGANLAKPHALPSSKILEKGELVLLDAGVKYARYCSDGSRDKLF